MFSDILFEKNTDYDLDSLKQNHRKKKDKTHLPIITFKVMKMVKVRGQGSRSDERCLYSNV